MGFFGSQMPKVVEWEQFNDDMIFWKWEHNEIKKGSRLIIRPGQDAIFMFNGKIEGVFADEGSFDIESQIIPFLSTLKGFKFGFNSGMRAEVLFINTREMTVKWGTKNPINIPAPNLPGGMPLRSFGTFCCKVADHQLLIDKVAGITRQFTIEDVKERIMSMLDQTFMRWVVREGKDIFNLQANAYEIGSGIQRDLDAEMQKIGIAITSFAISNVSYPPEIQEMATKAASQSMINDIGKYTQLAMADSIGQGGGGLGNTTGMATDMAGMQMGMMMGQQMANQMFNAMNQGFNQQPYQQGYNQQPYQQGYNQQPYQQGYNQQPYQQGYNQQPYQQGYNQQQPYDQQGYNQQQQPYDQQQYNQQPQQPPQQPDDGQVNLAKFCPKCGNPNPGTKFCPNCGELLAL